MEICRAVYRNTLTRRDAVYVLRVIEDDASGYGLLFGLYGTWAQFLADIANLTHLRGHDQAKYKNANSNIFAYAIGNQLLTLCYARENKGYELQAEYSNPGPFYIPNYTQVSRRHTEVAAPAAPTACMIDVAEAHTKPQQYDASRVDFIEL